MKIRRFACALLGALLLLSSLAGPAVRADEGMWTFDHPPTAAVQQRYGFTLTAGWLDHLRLSSVRFNDGGSGSFVSADGLVLTNHHVAQPWWKNDEMDEALKQGLQPEIAEMAAYFPEETAGVPTQVTQISSDADLALLHGDLSGLKRPTLRLDSRKEAAVSGQSLISLGYATGISAILARAGDETVDQILKVSGGDPKLVMTELAKRKLIRPLVTQGHIGDVLTDKIVYDAQTTSGGSGGPLMNKDGRVIGVTFAIVRGFGGSNFGVPIRFAEPLLKH